MNIIWSPLALERVSHTVKYIALDNPQAALNWENSIFEMVERFKEHPKSCENLPESTVFQLAALYGFGFARNHCFSDGSKRIALVSIDVFLQLNGCELIAEDAALTIEDLAAGEISEEIIVEWIEASSKQL